MADKKKIKKSLILTTIWQTPLLHRTVPVLFPQLRQVKLSWNPMRISITTNRQR